MATPTANAAPIREQTALIERDMADGVYCYTAAGDVTVTLGLVLPAEGAKGVATSL